VDPDSGDLLLVSTGDDAALRRIVERWTQPVYAVFERTREPSAASEATTDVFVELARTAASYRPESAFPAWLWQAVVRRLREDPADGQLLTVPQRRLADSLGARTAFLRSAVASLPPQERALFLLTRSAGLSVADAARAVGVAEAEALSLLVRAMDALGRALGPLLTLGDVADTGARSAASLA
jgi:RNA polymerase sigma-70 factor, ECF subfamily